MTNTPKTNEAVAAHDLQNMALAQVSAETQAFELVQRQAMMLSKSTLVPKDFIGNVANCAIALNIAKRTRLDPLMVCQNLAIIHGRPSWGSSFIIASLNSCGRFGTLRFESTPTLCKAVTMDKQSGAILEGPTVTMEMAKLEGWLDKPGSKWKTMPELMLKYRAAAFFGRLYAPEIMMGLYSADEVVDIAANNAKMGK